jgi:hypothetical protein
LLSGVWMLLLVEQLQSKLNLPWIERSITGRSNCAKVPIGIVKVGGVINRNDAVAAEAGSIEVRVVEDVEELGSKTKPHAVLLGN